MREVLFEDVKQAILEDSHNWQYPDYNGMIIVPISFDISLVIEYLKEFTCGEEGVDLINNTLSFDAGGKIGVKKNTFFGREFYEHHKNQNYSAVIYPEGDGYLGSNVKVLKDCLIDTSSGEGTFVEVSFYKPLF